jgi:hypothetical protein
VLYASAAAPVSREEVPASNSKVTRLQNAGHIKPKIQWQQLFADLADIISTQDTGSAYFGLGFSFSRHPFYLRADTLSVDPAVADSRNTGSASEIKGALQVQLEAECLPSELQYSVEILDIMDLTSASGGHC